MYKTYLGYVPIPSSAPRVAYVPILLSEFEQEQRQSGNGEREAIVMGAGLCDGETSVHTSHRPHIMLFSLSESLFKTRITSKTSDAFLKNSFNLDVIPVVYLDFAPQTFFSRILMFLFDIVDAFANFQRYSSFSDEF